MLNKSPAISLFLVSLVSAPAAMAAAPCKGLSQDACSSTQACTWVQGYTRKDGKKVDNYCRASGQKRSKAEPVPGKSQG